MPAPPPDVVVGGPLESLLLHADTAALIPKPIQMSLTIFMAFLVVFGAGLKQGKRPHGVRVFGRTTATFFILRLSRKLHW